MRVVADEGGEVDGVVVLAGADARALELTQVGRHAALVSHRIELRRRFADQGVPQPQFAGARTILDARAAADTVGFPAVLRPANSGGERGVFRVESIDDVERHLHAALAESPTEEAILDGRPEGSLLNAVAVARGGLVAVVLLADHIQPAEHSVVDVYPTTVFGDPLEECERVVAAAIHAAGLQDAICSLELTVTEDSSALIDELAVGLPEDRLLDLARHAIGVDLVEVALRQALGEEVPDKLLEPIESKPVAIRTVLRGLDEPAQVGGLEKVRAFPGVLEAEADYVIATAETNIEALERAEAASWLLDVEVPT